MTDDRQTRAQSQKQTRADRMRKYDPTDAATDRQPEEKQVSDRTVHGTTADDREIVRYDRAGMWYIEAPLGRMVPRERISLSRAVIEAARGKAFPGLPGGRAFDAAYRREVAL